MAAGASAVVSRVMVATVDAGLGSLRSVGSGVAVGVLLGSLRALGSGVPAGALVGSLRSVGSGESAGALVGGSIFVGATTVVSPSEAGGSPLSLVQDNTNGKKPSITGNKSRPRRTVSAKDRS